MRLSIIGTGYIGLVSGVCLAKLGHNVTCVDLDASKIARLMRGEVPIYEPGLATLMQEAMDDGRLHFTSNAGDAVAWSEAVFIAVGTPTDNVTGAADLSYVMAALRDIAPRLDSYRLVIMKSTVPPGTSLKAAEEIRKANAQAEFEMVSNPEFLREGSAVFDFMNPDRIVVGAETERARAMLNDIYAPLVERGMTMLHTTPASAEIIKYASNGFLAAKVAFINEVAALCEEVGASVQDVSKGMGLDDRIGMKFLNAGPGYGGSCFPKDTRALSTVAKVNGAAMSIVDAVIDSNERTKNRMISRIRDLAKGSVKGKVIAVLGVTFKPDTDDMRDAPSLTILPSLMGDGADVRIVDPQGRAHGEAYFRGATWFEDPMQAVSGADLVVVLTEWRMFRVLDLHALAKRMRQPVIADLRNIFSAEALRKAGFEFYQVGNRPAS